MWRVLGFLLLISGASPGWGCEGNNEIEAVFCRLKGKGVNLPSMDDFRRNTPRMQYLLLKRPAQQVGMALPTPAFVIKPVSHDRTTAKRTQKPQLGEKNAPSKGLSKSISTASSPSPSPSPSIQVSANSAESQPIERCALKGRAIHCEQQRFVLVENRFNHELGGDALTDANVLLLTEIPAGLEAYQKQRILSLHYAQYVDKMLKIGLGGVTMSYSQFYYIWEAAKEQGQEPSARFARMYEFLKRDKKGMGIDRRVDDRLPESLNQCMQISVAVWTCDKGRRNWVYARS